MNDLQKREFEILEKTLEIINKLGLTYYLVCGSALGAVKYNGFIPWDDDIDIALPRQDYEVFINSAQSFLPEHLFLQNYKTEKNFNLIFTKIRDTRTTYIENKNPNLAITQGVFIDVFPLDGYPTDSREKRKFESQLRLFRMMQYSTFDFKWNWKMQLVIGVERFLKIDKNIGKYINALEKKLKKQNLNNSELWCNYGNSANPNEYAPRKQYGEGVMMKFEGLDVRVPALYDEYLTQKYGDWRAELPIEEQVGHHYYEIFDLKHPYTDYIESISKDGKTIKLRKEPKND